jgi:hypothetical protein
MHMMLVRQRPNRRPIDRVIAASRRKLLHPRRHPLSLTYVTINPGDPDADHGEVGPLLCRHNRRCVSICDWPPHLCIGKKVYYRRSAVDHWLRRQEAACQPTDEATMAAIVAVPRRSPIAAIALHMRRLRYIS